MIKTCYVCGAEFTCKNNSQKYCSHACYRQAINARNLQKRYAMRAEKAKRKPKLTIPEVVILAEKEGLSYGQYVEKYAV